MGIQYYTVVKESTRPLPPLRSARLLDQVRERIRYLHYSIRTEQSYVHWVRAFVRFHGLRHPAEMGAAEVAAWERAVEIQASVLFRGASRPPRALKGMTSGIAPTGE